MSMRVLVSDPLEKEGISILEAEKEITVDVKTKLTPDQLKEAIKDYDAIIVRSSTKVTKDVIEAGNKLKVIGRAGVGLDNVNLEAASLKGVIVVNAPAGNTISTAEHTMSMIMALSRNIPQAYASLKSGQWDRKKFMGVELYGKTLGIIGLGRIGSEVAKRSDSFGMKVIAYDPFLSPEKASELKIEPVTLDDLFKRSDYITVHAPLTEETKYIIGKTTIAKMKKGVKIVNCARGGIINEEDLAAAISEGKVSGAALDVFEKEPPAPTNPLLKLDKVIMTPHLGASTEEAQISVAIDIAQTIRDILLNKGIRNAVNVPCVDPEMMCVMQPFFNLAEKIGSLQAQLVDGYIKKVEIKYVGDIIKQNVSVVTIAILKGMLTPVLQDTVNYVNARVIAQERGISVTESKTSQIQDFANLIILDVQTDKMKSSVMGTLFTKVDPRIVRINDYYVDAVPSGYMLVMSNKDVPGVVGSIGTLLGKNKINIAGMTFGRIKAGGEAISILNIDSEVPKDVLDQIKKAPNIHGVKMVKL